jgi:hypothetical protein
LAITKYESSFTISSTGDVSGDTYKGVFKVKTRLSHRDQLNRDRIRRDLLGSNPEGVGARAASIAEIFSQLAVRIVDAPSWWTNTDNGMDLSDDNVVAEVYEASIKAEADEVERVRKKGEEAKEALKSSE